MNPYKDKNLKKFLNSIPQEEIDKQTQLQDEENKRVYKEFIENLNIGKCFICNEQMNSFVENKPCFHWFTNPKGIKKKFFEPYLKNPIGFFKLDSYFRWLANSENFITNINDLKDETSSTSFLETTYKYKNIEWAFSIGYTDKEGHPNAQVGAEPHYHIQMKVDNFVFLKFNDFHIPFSDEDLFNLELFEQAGDIVKWEHSHGVGIGILEDEKALEIIDNISTIAENVENAIFNRQTFVEAPEGQTISGELIQQAINESKQTKQPIGKILQRLLTDAKITTIITPSDVVPNMTKRSGKK